MLEKYKGKEVRILVSSDSGAGCETKSTAGEYVALSTIITIYGILEDFDSKFLEIKESKINYIEGFNKSTTGFTSIENINSTVFENDIILVNVDKIISISII